MKRGAEATHRTVAVCVEPVGVGAPCFPHGSVRKLSPGPAASLRFHRRCSAQTRGNKTRTSPRCSATTTRSAEGNTRRTTPSSQEEVTLLFSDTSGLRSGSGFFFLPLSPLPLIHSSTAGAAAAQPEKSRRRRRRSSLAARTHVAFTRHLALTVNAAFSSRTSRCVAAEQQLAAQHD